MNDRPQLKQSTTLWFTDVRSRSRRISAAIAWTVINAPKKERRRPLLPPPVSRRRLPRFLPPRAQKTPFTRAAVPGPLSLGGECAAWCIRELNRGVRTFVCCAASVGEPRQIVGGAHSHRGMQDFLPHADGIKFAVPARSSPTPRASYAPPLHRPRSRSGGATLRRRLRCPHACSKCAMGLAATRCPLRRHRWRARDGACCCVARHHRRRRARSRS